MKTKLFSLLIMTLLFIGCNQNSNYQLYLVNQTENTIGIESSIWNGNLAPHESFLLATTELDYDKLHNFCFCRNGCTLSINEHKYAISAKDRNSFLWTQNYSTQDSKNYYFYITDEYIEQLKHENTTM